MSKREWIVLAAIAGAVAIGIAIEPDHEQMAGHGLDAGPDTQMATDPASGQHTVTLVVSGMT